MATSILTTLELEQSGLSKLLSLASEGKQSKWRSYSEVLQGKRVALVFLNPSLRTRASFQVGVGMLGGQSVVLEPGKESWALEFGEGAVMDGAAPEHVKEFCGVLSRYFDLVGVRAFAKMESWASDAEDQMIHAFKKHLTVPLISLESGLWHPCQGLADALTLSETFQNKPQKKTFVLSWAPHVKALPMAVPNSALLAAANLGMDVRLACPSGFELASDVLQTVGGVCEKQGGSFKVVNEQERALIGADVVYVKNWTPPQFIGQAFDQASYSDWKLEQKVFDIVPDLKIMHCLPVRRNVEISDGVLDSPQSLHLEQAENRLHAQNALMIELFKQEGR